MLPKKPRQLLYVLVFLLFSAIGTTAIAHNNVRSIFIEVASVLKEGVSEEADETAYVAIESAAESVKMTGISSAKAADIASAAPAPMFMTIIQGADALVTCSNDGATVARFILCGDSDDRSISLSGGPYGSVSWQLLDGAAPNTNDPCPNTNPSDYNPVSGNQTFLLAASSVSASTGAEYRVVADGQIFYFEVIKSTITQTYTKKDFVCNNPGRIEITGLPNNYQFRIREGSGGFGPYQSSSIFPNLDPGTYVVQTRLNIAGSVCEYLYDPIEIERIDIEIDVTFTNPVCSGEAGSIDVTVNPEVPGPYVYTLLNESGAEIEFTSTISSNTYSFGTVSEGTYAVKVETNDCKEDIPNGIPAPIQYNDTSGNPITVGTGLSPISVTTDTNGMSFGCSTISSVDIDVTPSGGSGTYSYTVSDGGNSGGNFTGTSSYTVTNPGTYTFYITDDQGCTAEKSEYVSELDPPEVTASDITGTCTNGGGKVQFTVTDAKGFNLEYRATNTTGDPFTSSSTIPVADGTYTIVEVRYSQGAFSCILALPPVTVTSAGGLIGSYTLTQDYTCANGEGIIVFDPASGGSGLGYEYSVDNVNYQSDPTFAGLTPGTTYAPYIRDDAGCYQALAPITISEPVPPTAINFTQDDLDCATGTSRVTVDVLPSGFPVAQYEIVSSNPVTVLPPAQTGNVFNGLSLDTSYQFEITDTNGCVYPASFTTGGISSIRARVRSGGDRRVCPGLTDGNGAFLIDGFATDYDYVITGPTSPSSVPSLPASGTSSSSEIPISGLGVGTYEITVTDNDTNCTSTVSFDVVEAATPLSVTLDVVTAMSCQNNNIGSVRAANATGGFPGYRYELEWPPSDGRTQGPKTGRTFGSLTAPGTYILTVIDSEGCRVSTTFDLTEIEAPTIAFGSADYCYSPTNDAGITVTSTAGTGTSDAAVTTHQYRINGGPFQTPGTAGTYTFNNLVPGDYTIEVVDANGCTDGLQVSIPPQLQIDLDLVTEIPCGGDGEMGITVSGGDISNLASTSYTIYLDGNPVAGHTSAPLPSSSFNYTVPLGSDGDYTVEVTDNNGCTNISPPLTFSPPASIAVLPPNVVGPSCGNANSGFVEIFPDVSVGTPPFQVAFAPAGTGLIDDPFNPDPGNTYNYSSQTVYSGLSAGTYEYIVKDARNCTTGVLTVTVNLDTTNPPDATVTPIDATCSGTAVSGGITISNITGGAPDFTIIVEDNFGNEFVRLENVTVADLPLPISDPSLVQGNYTVITLDSRGCIDQDAVSINSTELDIVSNFTVPTICDRGDLPQCVDIVGGVGPFDIRLVTDPSSPYIDLGPTATSHCFTGLVPGSSYTVQVFDEGTNCEYTETVDIPEGPNPLDVALSIDNGNCNGENVALEYTITGATGPDFDIVIRNLDTGAVVTNTTTSNTNDTFFVPQGPYDISVIDNGTDCTGGDTVEAVLNMPRVDVIDNQNANCNELGQLTVRGSGGTPFPPSGGGSLPDGSPYEYAFVDAGTPPVSDDYDTETTVYLAGTLAGAPYDIWVRDSRGCEYMTSATVIQLNPDLPDPGIVVNNQCNGTIPPSGFEIEVTMPASVENPTFILDGQTQTPVYDPMNPTTVTFNVGSSIGVYDVYVVDANGCDVTTTAEVYQILSASGNFSTEPTCNGTDGIITITANGGSGNFSFELRNGAGTPTGNITGQTTGIFTGVGPGDYEVMVTDDIANDGTIFCPFLVDGITLDPAILPVIDDTGESDISCFGAGDGSIAVSLQGGTDADGIQAYNLYFGTLPLPSGATPTLTNASGTFDNLGQNTYVVEVVTDRNCTDVREVTIAEPPVFEIDAIAGTLTCNANANQYSTTTVSAAIISPGNGGPYGYKIDPADSYQSSPNFEITDTGSDQTITMYAIDANGCEFSDSVTVLAPNNVTATITQVRPMDCENPERIRVRVTGTTNFIVRGQGSSVSFVGDQVQTSGNEIIFDLPMVAGEYRLEVEDVGGCIYPLEAYLVHEPVLPTVMISQNEPVGCISDTDGILNIEITNVGSLNNFSGIYDYWVYDAADPGFSGGVFGTPVAGNSTGTIDVVADGNPTTISGLPGGNLRVVIREQGKTVTGCEVFSNTSTIATPSEQLRITTLDEIGRVGCSDDLGEIVATTVGGWDGSPYEYMLEYENPVGSGFAPHSNPSYATFGANGNNNRFTGLSSGNYRVTVRDIEGCIHFEYLELSIVPPIQADAIVTRELECPTGADAVIVAVEPGTTTPGAIGGVPGGGYQYRLIKLDPNNPDPTDPTNHISSTGLQNEPEFVGTAGTGVIEGGWYVIEVVSTLNCQGFTTPVEVIPPAPINPALIQTSVPACGNDATMMIRVNNPQGGTYEYRRIYPIGHPLYLPPGDPSIVWESVDETDANNLPVKTMIPGNIGEAYRYEVRNVVGIGSCLARKTNGITITDAEPLSLDPDSPTFDISCAYEVDGRIEAIAEGGTGIYEFRIYDYDPDPANPDGFKDAFLAEALPTYQNRPSQDFGTFENLEEGTYYISVISRQTCGVVSEPFTIIAPDPVTIQSSATPTTCFGETDGSITMNVTSATAGLVKFAIEPNLSEFFSDPDNPMTYTFTDLAANTPSNPSYTVLAQDAEGCPQTFEIVITEPDELIVTDVTTTPETCIMAADGTAQLTITGGTPFVDRTDPMNPIEYYETRLVGPDTDGSEVFVRNDDLFFDNLAGGIPYIVFVRDANMCDTFVEVPVEIGVDLTAEPIVEYGCEGIFPNSTVRVALEDESRISEILFALDPVDPTDAVTAMANDVHTWGELPAGVHTVYIYHENGCTNRVEFSIEPYDPLTLNTQKTGPNELTAVAAGGFGGYEYFFNGESYGSEGVYTTTESGVVEVRVVDRNGCEALVSVPFEFTGMLQLPNFFTPNGDNENDFWSPKNREFFPNIEVIIYDRYGRVVAELDQVSKWDGLYDNKELPTGDYWYVVNQNDKRETRYVGHFTLYR